jgi:flavin-binding protein dodecin
MLPEVVHVALAVYSRWGIPDPTAIKQSEIYFKPNRRSPSMPVAKVSEIIASSTKSFDDAIKVGVARAHKTLRNIKSAWVQNQQVKVDDEGQIKEYRVQLKITFAVED